MTITSPLLLLLTTLLTTTVDAVQKQGFLDLTRELTFEALTSSQVRVTFQMAEEQTGQSGPPSEPPVLRHKEHVLGRAATTTTAGELVAEMEACTGLVVFLMATYPGVDRSTTLITYTPDTRVCKNGEFFPPTSPPTTSSEHLVTGLALGLLALLLVVVVVGVATWRRSRYMETTRKVEANPEYQEYQEEYTTTEARDRNMDYGVQQTFDTRFHDRNSQYV